MRWLLIQQTELDSDINYAFLVYESMAWTKPAFSLSEVNRAAEILISEASAITEDGAERLESALVTINNWRAIHACPLLSMRMTLSKRAKNIETSALISQRIKRIEAIQLKLRSHLINTHSGVGKRKAGQNECRDKINSDTERPVFGPATALFVGHSPLWGCSLLTPCGRPKSLAAPSASIYEMASSDFVSRNQSTPHRSRSLIFSQITRITSAVVLSRPFLASDSSTSRCARLAPDRPDSGERRNSGR